MPSDNQNERVRVERLRFAETRRQQQRDIDGHVAAIKSARADIEGKLRELQGHCDRLLRATRLAADEEGDTARFRLYHTAQMRMAGAMGHALKRAEATDRLLERHLDDQRERDRQDRERAVQTRVREVIRDVFDLKLPKDDDFEQLFGEVIDAS